MRFETFNGRRRFTTLFRKGSGGLCTPDSFPRNALWIRPKFTSYNPAHSDTSIIRKLQQSSIGSIYDTGATEKLHSGYSSHASWVTHSLRSHLFTIYQTLRVFISHPAVPRPRSKRSNPICLQNCQVAQVHTQPIYVLVNALPPRWLDHILTDKKISCQTSITPT